MTAGAPRIRTERTVVEHRCAGDAGIDCLLVSIAIIYTTQTVAAVRAVYAKGHICLAALAQPRAVEEVSHGLAGGAVEVGEADV